jgi:hypothetical protein
MCDLEREKQQRYSQIEKKKTKKETKNKIGPPSKKLSQILKYKTTSTQNLKKGGVPILIQINKEEKSVNELVEAPK